MADEIDKIFEMTDEEVLNDAAQKGIDLEVEAKRTRDIFEEAVIKWGAVSQINQAIEEMAELILALRHYDRGKATQEQVCSEIADVEIMMAQLRALFGDPEVSISKSLKINRLNEMIQAAKEGRL